MATRRTRPRTSKKKTTTTTTAAKAPTSREQPLFRLGRVLRDGKQREGGYSGLARAITSAYREINPGVYIKKDSDVIDRRKLKSLAEGGPGAVLSPDDLFALEPYLSRVGESLALRPILQPPDLIAALAASGRVSFLIGSRPETERRMVSEYDLLAMAEILHAIGQVQSSPRFEVKTVPLSGTRSPREDVRAFEPLLYEESAPSIALVASPRANLFAEPLLCAMCGVMPFGQGPRPATLPFQLCWNPKLENLYESHFRADIEVLRDRDPAMADEVEDSNASVLITPDRLYIDRVTQRGWGETYGVCVAQQRQGGQVWLLLLGITGVATYVSAKLANELPTRIGQDPVGKNSDVYWGVVEARVDESQKERLFDQRSFAIQEIFPQPSLSTGRTASP